MKLLDFQEYGTGSNITVNVDAITYFEDIGGSSTTIHFGAGHSVTVNGTLAQTKAVIASAQQMARSIDATT